MAPHYPGAQVIRRLNHDFRRPIVFTLHFAGAPEMFQTAAPITWKEAFWYVNSDIPRVLVPAGFPSQVVRHQRMIPFVDREGCLAETHEGE
jgi:hypothetical protein